MKKSIEVPPGLLLSSQVPQGVAQRVDGVEEGRVRKRLWIPLATPVDLFFQAGAGRSRAGSSDLFQEPLAGL
jgi:hypothetical protein